MIIAALIRSRLSGSEPMGAYSERLNNMTTIIPLHSFINVTVNSHQPLWIRQSAMTVCQAWWRGEITHNEYLIITLMMNLPWPLQNMLWICMCNKYKNIVTYQPITQQHRKWCEKCVIAWVIEQQGVKTALINKQPSDYNTMGLVSFKTIKKLHN